MFIISCCKIHLYLRVCVIISDNLELNKYLLYAPKMLNVKFFGFNDAF